MPGGLGRWSQKCAFVGARRGNEILKAALTRDIIPSQSGFHLVGVTGFEPATSSSRKSDAETLKVVELLMTKGADPTLRDGRGLSPMDVALRTSNAELVQLLKPGAGPKAEVESSPLRRVAHIG